MQVPQIVRVASAVIGFFVLLFLIPKAVYYFVEDGETKADRFVDDPTLSPVTDPSTDRPHTHYPADSPTASDPMSDPAIFQVTCHIYMDTEVADMGGAPKECLDPGYTINIACDSLLNGNNFGEENQERRSNYCCNKAFRCNAEVYCGEGMMKCINMNGSETPICVCPKGRIGHRCELCSDKKPVHCACHKIFDDLSEIRCESTIYTNISSCQSNHTVDGAVLPCLCKPDMYDELPESRCTGDPVEPCSAGSP